MKSPGNGSVEWNLENGIIFKETSENNVRNVNELFLEIAGRVKLKSDYADSAGTNAKDEKRSRAGPNGQQREDRHCCYIL